MTKSARQKFKKLPLFRKVTVTLTFLVILFLLSRVPRNREPLSNQQKQLVDKFGYPTSFVVVFGEMVVEDEDSKSVEYQTVRYETWDYYKQGRRFYFINGEFQKDMELDFIPDAESLKIRPSFFKEGDSRSKAESLARSDFSGHADVSEELAEGVIVLNLSDQVILGIKDDELVFVQAYPLVKAEGN